MVESVEKEAHSSSSALVAGGIFTRLFSYLFTIGVLQFFWFIAVISGGHDFISNPVIGLIVAFLPTLLIFVVEYYIYKYRKQKGWSYWRDVSEEWKKDRLDQLMREQKESAMRVNAELKGSDGDKSDIRYWHGLFKDGIISEEEYLEKKKELLK